MLTQTIGFSMSSNTNMVPISLFDTCPSAIVMSDSEGIVVHVNAAAIELFGYSYDEFVGRPMEETIVPEEHIEGHRAGMARHKKDGSTTIMNTSVRITARTKLNQILPIEITLTKFTSEDEWIIVAYIRDLREDVKKEREIETLNRFPLENPSPVLKINLQGKVIFQNQPSELLLSDEKVRTHLHRNVQTFLESELKHETIEIPSDTRTYLANLRKIENHSGITCNIYMTDITQLKSAERRLTGINLELENRVKQRTEELQKALTVQEQFVANTSHELRTPLNTILGITQCFAAKIYGALDEKQLSKMISISDAAEHLLEIINDLLDLTKLNTADFSLSKEDCNLEKLILEILELFKSGKFSFQTIKHHVDPRIKSAFVDPLRMKQIFTNLLSNASKFSAPNEPVRIEITTTQEMDRIIFVVENIGKPIPERMRESIFRPFIQVDATLSRKHEGTGLGLPIVSRLVHLHGGTIGVVPNLPDRVQVKGEIPWINVNSINPITKERKKFVTTSFIEPVFSQKKRILIADDHQINLKFTVDFLNSKGFDVTPVTDGEKALSELAANEFDIVLLDVQMPGIDGLEVLEKIRANPKTQDLPVVMVTGFASSSDAKRCLSAGATDFFSKPVKLKELVQKINDLVYFV